MSTFVQGVGREGLAIDELFAGGDDNLILGRGVVGVITLDLLDRTLIEIIVNHLINGRITLEVPLMLNLSGGH